MHITFIDSPCVEEGTLVLGVFEGRQLTKAAQGADEKSGGLITADMNRNRFTGKFKELHVITSRQDKGPSRIVLLGLGKPEDFDAAMAEEIGAAAYAYVASTPDTKMTLSFAELTGVKTPAEKLAAHFAFGAVLRSYHFDKYLTKRKDEDKPRLMDVCVVTNAQEATQKIYDRLGAVAQGCFLTRELTSEVANVLYPESFAEWAQKDLEPLGVQVTILDEKHMKKLGMDSLLSVGQGSEKESRLLIMEWHGGKKGDAPMAFVGKGITFDTGGISIKPSKDMHDMKWDMGGAAIVTGLMKSLAARKAPMNVVCVAALAENMPSGSATRPGDVVTSMSGQTIEILNTDAEGRLVLADALWYTQENFKPQFVVDLATLTGAIIMALGTEHAGLYANDDVLAQQLLDSGKATKEKLWRMPMGPEYDKRIDSYVADVQNISSGNGGGSITAAQFLKRFVQEGVKWAHLDVAGVVWAEKDMPLSRKGATGFGVRLLEDFLFKNYEA